MDVAIRLEVEESPLSLAGQHKVSVPVFTKHILRIDSVSTEPEHDYIQETIYFTNTNVKDASDFLNKNNIPQDAILVNPQDLNSDVQSLKATAQQKAIPLVLYTQAFD